MEEMSHATFLPYDMSRSIQTQCIRNVVWQKSRVRLFCEFVCSRDLYKIMRYVTHGGARFTTLLTKARGARAGTSPTARRDSSSRGRCASWAGPSHEHLRRWPRAWLGIRVVSVMRSRSNARAVEIVVAEELSRSQDKSRMWKTSRDLSTERLCLAKSRNLYNEYTPGRGDALQLAERRLVQEEK